MSVRENPAGETPARATELRLALENESSTFGAPLRFVLTLHNVSADPITVDGLLPPRASANPPMLEVTAADGRYLRTRCGTRPGLQTDAPMHLPPGASIVLMTGDLTACSGEARDPGDQELRAFPASETFFAPGAYEVRATFQPTSPDPGRFQGYGCASEVSALRVRGD